MNRQPDDMDDYPEGPRVTQTLGDELPRQQARVRELMGMYREIGPPGRFALALMEDALRRADKAVMEQDIVSMVRVCKELSEFKA